MKLTGNAYRFAPNDDINTDYIISGRYKFKMDDMNELAKHVMEDIDSDFSSKVQPGDFVVAGRNFGCGSSREQAPRALKAAGVGAVVAKSYARIFYRSSFNVGLPLIECDTDWIANGETLLVDMDSGTITSRKSGRQVNIAKIPKTMQILLEDGGLISHLKKHDGFLLEEIAEK